VAAGAALEDGGGGGPALDAGGKLRGTQAIARWTGAAWVGLGAGFKPSGSTVYALTVFDDGLGGGPDLYAGGDFTTAGGAPASRMAHWNGTAWSALGAGVDDDVRALAVYDAGTGGGPVLCPGGQFLNAGGSPANRIAAWDGASWSAVGSGVDGIVKVLKAVDGPIVHVLFAGGDFKTAGGVEASGIAAWDGASWLPVAGGLGSNPGSV